MGLSVDGFRDGQSVVLHAVTLDLFLQGRADGSVVAAKTMAEQGTQWTVHQTTNPGVFRFECEAISSVPLFLEGDASKCQVRVVSGSSEGMNWQVRDFPNPDQFGFDHVSLQCQSQGGDCPLGFLDLAEKKFKIPFVTSGHLDLVRLVSEASFDTAAHWEVIVLPVANDAVGDGGAGEGGPGPGGKPK
jgi:hypothetical protein